MQHEEARPDLLVSQQKKERRQRHKTSPLGQCYQTEVMVRFKNTFEGSNITCGAATYRLEWSWHKSVVELAIRRFVTRLCHALAARRNTGV